MRANASYYGGKVAIDRIVIKPYTSVRSAWADMLRRQVDMLYDVGVDALDSLESSSDVKVFTFRTGLRLHGPAQRAEAVPARSDISASIECGD